jgi:hypothetical protein
VLERPAERIYVDEQPGDVPTTHAETGDLEQAIGFPPTVSVEQVLARFPSG